MAKPGQRSPFINQTVQHCLVNRSAQALRLQLGHAALRYQDLDREVAADCTLTGDAFPPLSFQRGTGLQISWYFIVIIVGLCYTVGRRR